MNIDAAPAGCHCQDYEHAEAINSPSLMCIIDWRHNSDDNNNKIRAMDTE